MISGFFPLTTSLNNVRKKNTAVWKKPKLFFRRGVQMGATRVASIFLVRAWHASEASSKPGKSFK